MITKAQWRIMGVALFQEVTFNAYGLMKDNWISTTVSNGIETQLTDATITDRWQVHCLGVQIGFMGIILSMLFLERNRQTIPLFIAWAAYFAIQIAETVLTGNLQENELLADGVILVALFGTAIMLSRWIPKLYTYYTKWTK